MVGGISMQLAFKLLCAKSANRWSSATCGREFTEAYTSCTTIAVFVSHNYSVAWLAMFVCHNDFVTGWVPPSYKYLSYFILEVRNVRVLHIIHGTHAMLITTVNRAPLNNISTNTNITFY